MAPQILGSQTAGSTALRCEIAVECPPDWGEYLRRCDGGFFHAPTACELGTPPGESLFIKIYQGDEVVGIATGLRRACRLTEVPRHLYFPTYPALAEGVNPRAALDALIDALYKADAAELVLESFDAHWSGDATLQPTVSRARDEYIVPLDPMETRMWEKLATGHRRQVKKGDRSGWRIECPQGDEARSLLMLVQEVAARRAAARGSGFAVSVPKLARPESVSSAWGATVFAAWRDSTPLAAALVGWANGRAFYVMGGSTPAGYECGSSVWLHWRIACRLAATGLNTYNLGGASAAAASPSDPAHGLYRFKMGFGARVVACRSLYWTLSTSHARVHQLGRWLGTTPDPAPQEL